MRDGRVLQVGNAWEWCVRRFGWEGAVQRVEGVVRKERWSNKSGFNARREYVRRR